VQRIARAELAIGVARVPVVPTNDNSYDNLGRRYSNVAYGQRWSQVSAAPLRPWKAYTTEGGVSVPAIVRPPHQHTPKPPYSGFTHVTDLSPTFLELAGAVNPGTSYKGRTVYPITGTSLLPRLENRAWTVHREGEVFVDELFGRRYVRRDRWKLLFVEPPFGSTTWALHDLSTDRAEEHDVSAQHPQIVAELRAQWDAYVARVGVVLPNNNLGR
jgi:arylsulfatase